MTKKHTIDCSRPILTDQSFKDTTNINHIMEIYVKTGMLPSYSTNKLVFVDDTQQIPFETAFDHITFARQQFDKLPTSLKNELSNDYRKFESWLSNPENKDRALKMGLLKEIHPSTPEASSTDLLNAIKALKSKHEPIKTSAEG